jgi:L-ornithine N5-monooxygenase
MSGRDVELLAVGAGPSNLGLAVALEELAPGLADRTLIIERGQGIEWQPGLLLPWAKSQVSFLKDLVIQRNPRSRFSILSHLHATGRLDEFINMDTFTPYRIEISEYLRWVAASLARVRLELGRECVAIRPRRDDAGTITGWRTELADGTLITSRYLVIGTGRDAYLPAPFSALPPGLAVHSTRYRPSIAGLPAGRSYRVAVIGSSQSAAEMFRALREDLPDSDVAWIMRSPGPMADESTKFTNELYYPSYTDEFYGYSPATRQQILRELHKTNFACLTPALAEVLYADLYLDKLRGTTRSRLITMTDVSAARLADGQAILDLTDRRTGAVTQLARDLILLGTGFSWRTPALVRGLAEALGLDEVTVTRNYRLELPGPATAACYLQGINDASHGISDSLLSVLALRAQDIALDIVAHQAGAPAGAQADPEAGAQARGAARQPA